MSAAPSEISRKWTVLLYLAGDNNLTEECVYALTEAKQSLPDDARKLAVLAQFDPSGVRAETKRYLVRSTKTSLEDDARATGWRVRETDTGEPQNLLEFIRWGIAQFPAENYMVVLAGHGSGTDDDFLVRDENPPNALSIVELKDVFTQLTNDGHTIDILGMDTCVMSMAEVCFELYRTNVTFLVGSEGFAPNTGWPYGEIFEKLVDQINHKPADATPEWLATVVAEEYTRFYRPYITGGISVDQSVLEVKRIDEVKKKMFTLCNALIDQIKNEKKEEYGTPRQNAFVLAHWDAQSYNGEVFVDLHDFCERLVVRYNELEVEGREEISELCGEVINAINCLVVKNCVAGAAFQFSYGISIYFPWAVLSPRYANLAFPTETRWIDFLKVYHEKTRRRPGRSGEFLREDLPEPGRASVPINKGRDARVESMRNPPIDEYVGCFEREIKNAEECEQIEHDPKVTGRRDEPNSDGSGSTSTRPSTKKSRKKSTSKR